MSFFISNNIKDIVNEEDVQILKDDNRVATHDSSIELVVDDYKIEVLEYNVSSIEILVDKSGFLKLNNKDKTVSLCVFGEPLCQFKTEDITFKTIKKYSDTLINIIILINEFEVNYD